MQPIVAVKHPGMFDPAEWLKEGDGLFASARELRALWQVRRRALKRRLRAQPPVRMAPREWQRLEGMPRASLLLLGYAVEMYLKSGLTGVYRGCRPAMFERDLRRVYGHDLGKIAREIDYPGARAQRSDFRALRQAVLFDARYPIAPVAGQSFHDQVNRRTARMWDRRGFARLCRLAREVRAHASRIDRDPDTPAFWYRADFDDGGYLAFRSGGGLSPRITLRLGPTGHEGGDPPAYERLRRLACDAHPQIAAHWDRAAKRYDGDDKTVAIGRHEDPAPQSGDGEG